MRNATDKFSVEATAVTRNPKPHSPSSSNKAQTKQSQSSIWLSSVALAATACFALTKIDWQLFAQDSSRAILFPKIHHKHVYRAEMAHRARRETNNDTASTTTTTTTTTAATTTERPAVMANSHNPSMNFILQEVKEIPLDQWNEMHGEESDIRKEKNKNFTRYLYPSSEYVPLQSLDRICK